MAPPAAAAPAAASAAPGTFVNASHQYGKCTACHFLEACTSVGCTYCHHPDHHRAAAPVAVAVASPVPVPMPVRAHRAPQGEVRGRQQPNGPIQREIPAWRRRVPERDVVVVEEQMVAAAAPPRQPRKPRQQRGTPRQSPRFCLKDLLTTTLYHLQLIIILFHSHSCHVIPLTHKRIIIKPTT